MIAELQLAIDYPEHEDSILEDEVLRESIKLSTNVVSRSYLPPGQGL